jgi:hypothetical protein
VTKIVKVAVARLQANLAKNRQLSIVRCRMKAFHTYYLFFIFPAYFFPVFRGYRGNISSRNVATSAKFICIDYNAFQIAYQYKSYIHDEYPYCLLNAI